MRKSVLGWLVVLLVLCGCQTGETRPGEAAIPPTQTNTPPPPTSTNAPLPPVVAVIEHTPTPFPALSLMSEEEVAEMQATAAVTNTPIPDTPVPTNTATPLPTFTPPALPNTPEWEHYWFRRPIATGGTVWTNKTYPYGSTLGGRLRIHHGVEFDVALGTEVLAVASGTVRVAGNDLDTAYGPETNFYGNLVVIEHDSLYEGQPVYSLYAHLLGVNVGVGQEVDALQVIGFSGKSGIADGPHLHFEVRVGQNDYLSTRNPLLWLVPFPDKGTVAGRVVWPDGSVVHEAPVTLNRIDGESPYYATTSYAVGDINVDEGWDENFVIDDVNVGYYEVIVNTGETKYKVETWVYPYQTSFVEIVLE